MDLLILYLFLFAIIAIITQVFEKSAVPAPLILVISGMLLSLIPYFPIVHLNSSLVLDFFLPLLIYQISSFSSWRDIKKQIRPITLLSIGHVFFITIMVALVIHALLPAMGWPLAFVLGAIISPPDDVAISAIAEKIKIPERLLIILQGEAMFNDAAALTLFRFALVAAITNHFYVYTAALTFVAMVIGEIIYGCLLGYVIGKCRTYIKSTSLHLIVGIITPFLAYIPAVKCDGTGIIATATVGFIIGNHFALRFTPEYRLASYAIWPAIATAIQSLIFLLVGLDLHAVMQRISAIPLSALLIDVLAIVAVVIIGRFVWVFASLYYLPRLLFPSIRKREPRVPWQYPVILSWAGIRGGISLAAALAVPALTIPDMDFDPRDLLVFLVFTIIFVTLILQGFTLPWLLRISGIDKVGHKERYCEHLNELQARLYMIEHALSWLNKYCDECKKNKDLKTLIQTHIYEYELIKTSIESRIANHASKKHHDNAAEVRDGACLTLKIVDIEREALMKLWRDDQINLRTRNKLGSLLDHQIQRHLI